MTTYPPRSQPGTPLLERILARVSPEPNTGCWLWTGHVNPGGYGSIKIERRSVSVHRAMWMQASGRTVPSGMDICHKCDVRVCVNPAHLFPGTRSENMLDCGRKFRNIAQLEPSRIGGFRRQHQVNHRAIVAMRAAGTPKVRIARAVGVSPRTIDRVLSRHGSR